jgi:hypothetical protein
METMDNKILNSYVSIQETLLNGTLQVAGISALGMGILDHNSAIGILGGSLLLSGSIGRGVSYAKAYFEANLDYKANGKFTKLKN